MRPTLWHMVPSPCVMIVVLVAVDRNVAAHDSTLRPCSDLRTSLAWLCSPDCVHEFVASESRPMLQRTPTQ